MSSGWLVDPSGFLRERTGSPAQRSRRVVERLRGVILLAGIVLMRSRWLELRAGSLGKHARKLEQRVRRLRTCVSTLVTVVETVETLVAKLGARLFGSLVADEHPQEQPRKMDPVDKERYLGGIAEELTDAQIEELYDLGAGVPQTELAAEAGVAPNAKYKQTERLRDRVMRAVGAKGFQYGSVAALLAGMVMLYFGVFREPENAAGGRAGAAAEQRRMAADSCKERRWNECEKALDLAAQLDEEGDRAPEVVKLRAAIAAGRGARGEGDAGGKESGARGERR